MRGLNAAKLDFARIASQRRTVNVEILNILTDDPSNHQPPSFDFALVGRLCSKWVPFSTAAVKNVNDSTSSIGRAIPPTSAPGNSISAYPELPSSKTTFYRPRLREREECRGLARSRLLPTTWAAILTRASSACMLVLHIPRPSRTSPCLNPIAMPCMPAKATFIVLTCFKPRIECSAPPALLKALPAWQWTQLRLVATSCAWAGDGQFVPHVCEACQVLLSPPPRSCKILILFGAFSNGGVHHAWAKRHVRAAEPRG